MSFNANVLRVMIASPSDVPEARDAVERAIHSWNDANSRAKQVVLVPWRWETSSIPMLGGHPQKLINAQGVDDSDIVFALFGGRLGSPTPDAVSGTAEEIDRAVELGKPVHLYFSTAPLPSDIDTAQLDALRAFRQAMEERGLLGEFSNVDQLNHEVWKAIEHDLTQLRLDASPQRAAPTGVDLIVQPGREREVNSFDSKGKPRYRTRHWLDIENRGDVDAEQVVLEPVGQNAGVMLVTTGKPTVIHRGQSRRFAMEFYGGGGDPVIKVRWVEDGEPREKDYHVG
ncbi:DUF4062 domain-containing protein [Microbacterium sp. cx-59]|uniref:DUF4062 domain-containing protein n=1 Tax=Microbacterium sp. cx-59 TaxID=2891207 RepID=UPI001E4127F5|nr:DUF4062 domain-containing protein [Microbacterium sp. cx-59]MCC4908454.1 DUF4062 domain-containing protein [Microbacterium sp. cx-59]